MSIMLYKSQMAAIPNRRDDEKKGVEVSSWMSVATG